MQKMRKNPNIFILGYQEIVIQMAVQQNIKWRGDITIRQGFVI